MGLKRRLTEQHDRHARVRKSKQDMAQKAWRLLMKVAERQMEEVGKQLTRMGLSPVQGHFLDELARMPSGPMSQLVTRMDVDPGWVTDIIDKLEQRGDVIRRPSPDDRRVKIIELTEKGRETWRTMDDTIATAPPELEKLNLGQIAILLNIAQRLAKAAGVDAEPPF
jgi:DNA-binding MarR family transcriptional regulator